MAGVHGPDWPQLERIRATLIAELSEQGVQRIEFATAFEKPYDSSVWLGTNSDDQRDELLASPNLLADVQSLIARSGLDVSLVTRATAQSQETVDREYDGSWFYALR